MTSPPTSERPHPDVRAILAGSALLLAGVAAAHSASALPDRAIATPAQQFGLPFAGAPGPDSWLTAAIPLVTA